MAQADFRFYAELNYFLPPSRRLVNFAQIFEDRPSIKDMIEAQGVPHTEVDLILVNGESVDFCYIVQDGDRISVYSVSDTDIAVCVAMVYFHQSLRKPLSTNCHPKSSK